MRRLSLILVLLATPASADVFLFETPSGNIECSVGLGANSADIACTILNRQGPTALPRPASCGATWGHRFELLERGPVRMICTNPPRNAEISEKAAYGETGRFGDITCQSERTGFTCRNADGHGFFLSRRRQTVF